MSLFSGSKLKELRVAAGLSQKALALQSETTQQSVARWESGKAEPSGTAILKLSEALGVSVKAISEGAARGGASAQVGVYRAVLSGDGVNAPWGTARIRFEGISASFDFPIDEWNESLLRDEFREFVESGDETFRFESADGRLVAFKVRELLSVELISDDVEGMPSINRDSSQVEVLFADGSKAQVCEHHSYKAGSEDEYQCVQGLLNDFQASVSSTHGLLISRVFEEGEDHKKLINMGRAVLMTLPLKPFHQNDYDGEADYVQMAE